jgi:hypothetical protein
MTHYGNHPIGFQGVSNVTASLGANDPEPGYRLTVGDEDYVFVYNAGNSQISPTYGAVMVDFLVGVVKHATLTTGTYGWLVTKGFAAVEMEADNSAAAGQILALAADGEFALKSNSTGYPTPAVGKTMEAIASAGSGVAFISVN